LRKRYRKLYLPKAAIVIPAIVPADNLGLAVLALASATAVDPGLDVNVSMLAEDEKN
jgi:hypothetical protein